MKNETQLVPYSLEAATVEALKSKYMDVTIPPDDKSAYAMVMSGLRECREIRLAVDAWHKEKKEWIVKAGKHYDSERRRIHALVAPIEDHLSEVRKGEDDRKEAIRAEAERKENERIDTIKAKIVHLRLLSTTLIGSTSSDLRTEANRIEAIPIDDSFMEFQEEAKNVKHETLRTVYDALDRRIRVEQEFAAQKAEAERLERIRKEQEAQKKLLEEAQAKIESEKKALEDAKRTEKERQERAEFERRAREEAKARAEAEAKAKVEREAKEKAEREEKERIEKERQEALRPDKEKIANYITALMKVPIPDVGTESAKQLVDAATTALKKWASKLMKQAQEL